MNESPERTFGLTIAFLLPGFVCLWGISSLSPVLKHWLSFELQASPTIASFLYTLLASLATGLTISAVRWAIIDTLHHRTGVPYPHPDFSKLQERLEAFKLSVELYYRYYQFYANMFIAVLIAASCWLVAGATLSIGAALTAFAVEAILLAASRDSLDRYYVRISLLLGTLPSSKSAS